MQTRTSIHPLPGMSRLKLLRKYYHLIRSGLIAIFIAALAALVGAAGSALTTHCLYYLSYSIQSGFTISNLSQFSISYFITGSISLYGFQQYVLCVYRYPCVLQLNSLSISASQNHLVLVEGLSRISIQFISIRALKHRSNSTTQQHHSATALSNSTDSAASMPLKQYLSGIEAT